MEMRPTIALKIPELLQQKSLKVGYLDYLRYCAEHNQEPMTKQSFKNYRDGNVRDPRLNYGLQMLKYLGYTIDIS